MLFFSSLPLCCNMNDQIRAKDQSLISTDTAVSWVTGWPTHSCDLTFYRNKISEILHPSPHSIFCTRNKEREANSCHFCAARLGSAHGADFARIGALNLSGWQQGGPSWRCIINHHHHPSVLASVRQLGAVQRTGCWNRKQVVRREDDIIVFCKLVQQTELSY